jgi:hypothetical protein
MSSRDRARDKVERVTDGDHPDSQHPDSESGHHQRHHTPVPQMAMPTAQFSLLRAGLSAGAVAWRLELKPLCGFGSAPNAFGSALACAAPPTRQPTAIAALTSIFLIDITGISFQPPVRRMF